MNLIQSINEMKMLINQAEGEVYSLQGGKKASSSRARKSLQNIKAQAHSLRQLITHHSKTMPTKPRVKKVAEAAPVEAPVEQPVVEVPSEPAEPIKEKKVRKKKSV